MKILAIFMMFCLLITGCKVGPDYRPPEVYVPNEFIEDRPCETKLVSDEDLVEWWAVFNDPFLNELLEIAINQNFDYLTALEQVYQARSNYWIQFTSTLPEFMADSLDTRYRTSRSFRTFAPSTITTGAGPYNSFFQLGLDAIWEIDLWGKFRRSAAAAYDMWEASVEDLRGVKIIVISEVASTYATICALQQKVAILRQALELDQELLTISRTRFEAGLTDEVEVENSIGILKADTAQLFLLETSLKQTIYSLSILLGMLPECIVQDFQIERPIPRAEGLVPISLPSELLRRRPDISAAERLLAAATEDIGVAVADLYPSVSLAGSSSSFAANPLQGSNIGLSSDRFNKLFKPASLIWGYGLLTTMPVFDFGKRCAAVEVQVALRNQAYYNYQKTVIAAFQETEQSLIAFFNDEKREESLDNAVKAYWRALTLATDQYQAGLTSYTQVVQIKQEWLAALNSLTDSQEALATDFIAIYKALGGDW